MPPQTPDPQGQEHKQPAPAPQSGAGHVDFDKLVLKRKDAPSVDSARRINAGALFEQEQSAALETPKSEPAPAPAAPKPEQPLVRPLQTYQSDIASLVDTKNVSVVSIAAAEADRRTAKEAPVPPGYEKEGGFFRRNVLMMAAGVALFAAAGGIGYYVYAKLQPVPVPQQFPAPFILVDDTQTVAIDPGAARGAIMDALVDARDNVRLSAGLVARLLVVKQGALQGSVQEVGAPELLQAAMPKVPPALVRTLEPQMLLGVHSYDENAPFLILKADSYETAYSGLLAWEATMQADLSPLFKRTPPVHARPAQPAAPATTTDAASSTPATLPAPSFLSGNFIDQIVDNRDARVVLDQNGDILLLWTFLDRDTIVITTNEATLREVISRLSQASIISLPGGN